MAEVMVTVMVEEMVIVMGEVMVGLRDIVMD
jgi:hypothetical protein